MCPSGYAFRERTHESVSVSPLKSRATLPGYAAIAAADYCVSGEILTERCIVSLSKRTTALCHGRTVRTWCTPTARLLLSELRLQAKRRKLCVGSRTERRRLVRALGTRNTHAKKARSARATRCEQCLQPPTERVRAQHQRVCHVGASTQTSLVTLTAGPRTLAPSYLARLPRHPDVRPPLRKETHPSQQ